MPSWRRIFTSPEARIEALAGASPPDFCPINRTGHHWVTSGGRTRCDWCGWPFPRVDAAGDEDQETPDE